MNYIELMEQKQLLECKLRGVDYQLKKCMGRVVIGEVIASSDLLDSDYEIATKIAEKLSEVGYPISRWEIRELFEWSGLKFNESHVELSRPATLSEINEYNLMHENH